MTTSRQSFLSDVLNAERIPIGKLAYFRGRLTNRIHALVLEEFSRLSKAGKINRAQLAKRIGRDQAQVTRWLGSPGNWTIETFSDLLLAMGCEPSIGLTPLVNTGAVDDAAVHNRESISTVTLVAPEVAASWGTSGKTVHILGTAKDSVYRANATQDYCRTT